MIGQLCASPRAKQSPHILPIFLSPQHRSGFFCSCLHSPAPDPSPQQGRFWLSLPLATAQANLPPLPHDPTNVPKAHIHQRIFFLMETKWNNQPSNPTSLHTHTCPFCLGSLLFYRIKYNPPHGVQDLSEAPTHFPARPLMCDIPVTCDAPYMHQPCCPRGLTAGSQPCPQFSCSRGCACL